MSFHLRLLIVLAMAGLSTAALAGNLVSNPNDRTLIGADVRGCALQPDAPWCAGSSFGTLPLGPPQMVEALYGPIVDRMRLSKAPSDPSKAAWVSKAKDADRGLDWRGECAELVLTVIDSMYRKGYDLTSVRRVLVDTDSIPGEDHMVGVFTYQGRDYVFADGRRDNVDVYPIENAKWKPVYAAPANSKIWTAVHLQP